MKGKKFNKIFRHEKFNIQNYTNTRRKSIFYYVKKLKTIKSNGKRKKNYIPLEKKLYPSVYILGKALKSFVFAIIYLKKNIFL